jgi:hypothetical protein
MGQTKTIELIRRNFWWPQMDAEIIQYVEGCPDCQKNKAPRHSPYGKLQPLELPYAPWQSISMDFITDLPLSEDCDQLWVIVDRFTKMAHFIPLQKGEQSAENLARVFTKEIWRMHGLPLDIVSDRDSRFTSKFWKALTSQLGIRARMSTAFHPQTDGQTERTNQTIEAYLRAFVNPEMDNWVALLPTAEFAYNNTSSSSSRVSPFYANYGFHPSANNPPRRGPRHPASELYSHWMTNLYEETRELLGLSQERMKKYSDKKRKDSPPFEQGQLVMLNGKNVKTRRPSKKLDHKLLGPFQVDKVISPTAVRLKLPSKWRIHNTFHVSLIEPYKSGGRPLPDPKEVLEEANKDQAVDGYNVDKIMASTMTDKGVRYLTKWEGWPRKKDWTWEPFEHFYEPTRVLLSEFHQRNPDAPRDPRVE